MGQFRGVAAILGSRRSGRGYGGPRGRRGPCGGAGDGVAGGAAAAFGEEWRGGVWAGRRRPAHFFLFSNIFLLIFLESQLG
jgi:hypothetical protein